MGPEAAPGTDRRAGLRTYAAVAVLVLVVLGVLFLAVEALQVPLLTDPRPWLSGHDTSAAAIGLALLVVDVALPVPSSVVMVANGALFGPVVGTALSMAGSLGAALLGLAVGRRSTVLLQRLVPADERRRASELLDRYGVLAVMATRPVPLLAETTVLLAGASGLGVRRTAAAAALGSLPAALLYALAGDLGTSLASPLAIAAGVLVVTGVTWGLGALGSAWGRRR
jgi:uncharacterized membrane protein YdjX (TVP38/TMEM64 family)